MRLDPYFVGFEDDERHLAEEAEGWVGAWALGGEEEDGGVDERAWLSEAARGELERAWAEAEGLDVEELPF